MQIRYFYAFSNFFVEKGEETGFYMKTIIKDSVLFLLK